MNNDIKTAAIEILKLHDAGIAHSGRQYAMGSATDKAWRALRDAIEAAPASSAMAMQQVEPSRPDILEKLTYHKYERADLTLDDCLEYLANRWKRIHGRPERALIMQITELLASQPSPVQPTPDSAINPAVPDTHLAIGGQS